MLGGYPTLSATSRQGRSLLDQGRAALAAAYLFATLALCLLAVPLAATLVGAEPDGEA